MPLRFLIIVLALAAILAAAVVISIRIWGSIAGDGGMDGHGVAALIIGAAGSLLLGGGLMALVFFSARRGYDDRADAANRLNEENGP